MLFFAGCLPKVPPYPYAETAKATQQAQELSARLEAYIKAWHQGKASAQIPADLLPRGYDTSRFKNIRLVKYEAIDPKQQWVLRPAHKINMNALYASFPDPNCSYMLAPIIYAPFGAQLHMEGEFPYCRFFSIQVTPPFDPYEYRYDKWAGKGEVAIVDADITPKKGSVNPFLPHGNRLATNRSYDVVFEMAAGNPSVLNLSHKYPYRVQNNKLYGSAIQFQGPWGQDTKSGHGRGLFDFGDVWVRYFAIDKNKDVRGGVPLPKLYFELKSGEKFFVIADLQGFMQASEQTMPNRSIGNNDPAPYNGPNTGWDKQFGIFLQISTGASRALYKSSAKDMAYIRELDKGVTGRGEAMPAPASYEPHATSSNFTNYLTMGMSLKKGKVFVLTGKLPTFPDTRNSAASLQPAQCRYWSLTSYDADFPFSKLKGLENTSLMDDEMVLNKDREYIIVYARREDRPVNATAANGVTWVEWGNTGTQAFTLRWISVGPEWSFELTPHEENLPWARSTFTGTQYDKTLVGSNKPGFLRAYHPVKHLMTREAFEKLGSTFSGADVPEWK